MGGALPLHRQNPPFLHQVGCAKQNEMMFHQLYSEYVCNRASKSAVLRTLGNRGGQSGHRRTQSQGRNRPMKRTQGYEAHPASCVRSHARVWRQLPGAKVLGASEDSISLLGVACTLRFSDARTSCRVAECNLNIFVQYLVVFVRAGPGAEGTCMQPRKQP